MSSTTTKNRSKRDRMGGEMLTFWRSVLVLSYRPNTGLAAAKMDVRAFRVAWMPALVIEMVCDSTTRAWHR